MEKATAPIEGQTAENKKHMDFFLPEDYNGCI